MHYYGKGPRRSARRSVTLSLRGVGIELLTPPGLFSVKEVDKGTVLLLENAVVPERGNVLDLGCGYGVIGIFLAKYNPQLRVYMVDINPRAVKIAKLNAKINGVEERVEVLLGNLYDPLPQVRFSSIFSNPPLAAGKETVNRIIEEAPSWLEEGGMLQVVLAKGGEEALKRANSLFSEVRVKNLKGYTLLFARK